MNSNKVIVVEDNDIMRLGITESLSREGYEVHAFSSGPEAEEFFRKDSIPVAVIDLKMEPMDGIEVLRRFKEINPSAEVLMISAFGTVESAVQAIKLGAADFLTKPFAPEELRIRVKKLFEKYTSTSKITFLMEQNRLLSDEISRGYEEIIGHSAPMKSVFSIVDQVALSDSTVLIEGESGTGKELIARAIHRKSNRSLNPFIKINCGALNENLLESELFGHEKGSFTGAYKLKKGRFELADSGTLFLDEIGDVSPSMQVKLLRVLQEGEFERVGGEVTIKTDVRIIAATNRDLKKMIQEEKFRQDLYYRLSVIPVTLPPLRERKEDIPLLADFFLKRQSQRYKQPFKTISNEGLSLMLNYSWPGNIRELENLIERLFVISTAEEIDTSLIGHYLCGNNPLKAPYEALPLEDALYELEKNMITDAMKKAGGVKNRAAKILGISTSVLYYKLEKFGLL
ncbi:MAG: sigma-54-dependent transcriptional regulator [Bacteroidota bacterium]|jgi:DNA-binding NtrC family response regulator|nr:sigma-54-dependent Fis family transcriptional regulator [Ignavibacteria bacterium]MCU7498753.1 sigma-54-dependent Fis family transcriptional regulator [Ignavibacteria bacterium]MCU7512053.1 sigma-54-dependent Fis family transcriptional regulator [Ignavibacteria bacterium]MCU7520586.1 sigma-54-dependent Fis family transcriptional regulator [Ignavibacteria bacterium]MCU7523484.1 sigma-54-dependent Fis family transcriptional regulator [Ignavibacteria bacterium]